jgi:hypothetical protein
MERCRVIDVGKRFVFRNGDAQECTERLPPLLDVEDQQSLWGNRRRVTASATKEARNPIH